MLRRLSFPQLFLAMVIGVAGGLYIYKPVLEQYIWDQRNPKAGVKSAEVVERKEE